MIERCYELVFLRVFAVFSGDWPAKQWNDDVCLG